MTGQSVGATREDVVMDVDQERIGAVRSLGALPLFQLSTAGVKREQLVEASHAAYFDLDGLARAFPGLRPYQGNRRWLGYEPDFVYRYGRLDPATTWDELAAICRE